MNDIQISEKKLEDFIYNHISGKDFYPGFSDIGEEGCQPNFVFRQFNLTPYGIADIVTFDIDYNGSISATIYELKQGEINADTLVQVYRYKTGLNEILLEHMDVEFSVSCVLIGNKISGQNGFNVAVTSIDDLCVYLYDICPKTGLSLQQQSNVYQEKVTTQKTISKLTCIDYTTEEQCREIFFGSQNGGVF